MSLCVIARNYARIVQKLVRLYFPAVSVYKIIRTGNQLIEYPKELLVRDPYCVTTSSL